MKDVQKFAAESEPRRGDRITGWFGMAEITDVAYGFVTDAATDEPVTDPEDMIRVRFNDGSTTYIYRSDIERNLTAEDNILRA